MKRFTCLVGLICLLISSDVLPGEPKFELNIPQQSLANALNELHQQTGVLSFFPFDLVADKKSNAVIGKYTLRQGLSLMLMDTGLKGGLSHERVISISLDSDASPIQSEEEEMKTKDFGKVAVAGALVVANVGVTSVLAQDGGTSALALEEIVVTARKREETLQSIPIAVTAFSGNGLELRGYSDISAIANATPNLVFDTAPPVSGNSSGASVFLRGVGQLDFTINVDPGVGVYVDGAYVSRSVGSVLDLLDVERVEILRGPQGTLFGRNTIGGAIQYISKRPADELSGKVKTIFGSDSRADLLASVDVPFSETFRSKFTILSKNRDGYVTDGRGVDLGDDSSVSGQALFDWDISENFTAKLNIDFSSDDENGAPNVPIELFAFDGEFGFVDGLGVTAADDFGTRFNFFSPTCPFDNNDPSSVTGPGCFGDQQNTNDIRATNSNFAGTKSENDVAGASLVFEYDFGNVQLKSITAGRTLESEFGRDSDHSAFPIFATANVQDQDQFSQEIQLSGSTERSRWVIGGYYFNEEAFEYTQIFLPAFGGPVLLSGQFFNDVDNESTSLFGEYTFDLNDKLTLTLGARYTDESKFYASDQGFTLINGSLTDSLFLDFDPNDPSTNPETLVTFDVPDRNDTIDDFVVTLIDEPGQTLDFDDTNVRINLAYQPNDSTLIYGTFSDAFKSGGFNPRYLAPTADLQAISFDPESVESFELGYKYSNSNFRANFALFFNDYTDIQISADSPSSQGATVTQNAAAATISGFEAEFTYANGGWLIEGGLGVVDAEYDELGDGVDSAVTLDSRFPRIPEFTSSLGVSYLQALSTGAQLTYRVDGSYRGDSEGTVQNDPQAFQDDYFLLNAVVNYRSANDKWSLSAGVTNLTDEEFTHSVNVNQRLGYAEAVFARGSEFYISAEYSFGN